MLRIVRAAGLWIVLFLLAAFVIFVEFVADTGGRAAPIPEPTNRPGASASPGVTGIGDIEAMPISLCSYCRDSSSKTRPPLS